MNLSDPRSRRHLVCLGVLLAPLGGVLFVKASNQAGPRTTLAAATTPASAAPAPQLPTPAAPPTTSQRSASEWLKGHRQQLLTDTLPSPMYRIPAVPVAADPVPEVAPIVADAAPRLEIPSFRLTGFVISGEGKFASINHTFIREGQEVLPSWTLKTVDGPRRRVVLLHTSGATVELFSDTQP